MGVGFLVGGYIVLVIGNAWVAILVLFILGAVFQVLYTRSLYAFLGGADPVQLFGARNLYELQSFVSLPIVVLVLDFLAKVFMAGGVLGILLVLGIAQIVRG